MEKESQFLVLLRQLVTAVTRNCWFFLASTLFSRINSILADRTQFVGITTSRGRETLGDISEKLTTKNPIKILLMLPFKITLSS